MKTATSKGVKISVQPIFRPEHSDIVQKVYLFNYTITIENLNPYPIQLNRRQWKIFDSLDQVRYVDGIGVIGEQPLLEPGEVFTYSSACDLTSELGFMEGFYIFKQLDFNHQTINEFRAEVPRFQLECPTKLN